MSERGWLFIVSVLTVIGSLACSGWLVATGRAFNVDGLFLLLTCLLLALAFALYLFFLIRRALEELTPETSPKKKTPAPAE
jgi:membrane protein implicated in regulation of membrane protease activity